MARGAERPRGHADESLEGPAGGGLGLIAQAACQRTQPDVALLQPRLRSVHLPPRGLGHRRLAHQLREPRREGRAGHPDLGRQRGERPDPRGTTMDQRDRATGSGGRGAPTRPVWAPGSRAIPERMPWTTRMSASRVITVSPPARRVGLDGHSRSVLWSHSASGEVQASTVTSRGRGGRDAARPGGRRGRRHRSQWFGAPPPRWRSSSYRSLSSSRGMSNSPAAGAPTVP